MKIYRPVKSEGITQRFGENLSCVKLGLDGKPIRPFQVLPGTFTGTCPIGSSKFYEAIGLKGHNGVDSIVYHGEPVYFPVVADTRWQVINEVDADGGIGVNVYALDPVPFDTIPVHEQGSLKMIETQYQELGGKLFPMFKFWHLLSTTIPDHGIIKTGDLIGYGDNTGASSGDHLHWSMKIHGGTTNGFGFSIDSDNGYTGALDHLPYFEDRFILDILKPSFSFTKTLTYGITDTDVGVMQALLVRYGYMEPFKTDEIGIFGPKTRAAVFAFQLQKVALTWYEKNVLRGSIVGPKTIEQLNILARS